MIPRALEPYKEGIRKYTSIGPMMQQFSYHLRFIVQVSFPNSAANYQLYLNLRNPASNLTQTVIMIQICIKQSPSSVMISLTDVCELRMSRVIKDHA